MRQEKPKEKEGEGDMKKGEKAEASEHRPDYFKLMKLGYRRRFVVEEETDESEEAPRPRKDTGRKN